MYHESTIIVVIFLSGPFPFVILHSYKKEKSNIYVISTAGRNVVIHGKELDPKHKTW